MASRTTAAEIRRARANEAPHVLCVSLVTADIWAAAFVEGSRTCEPHFRGLRTTGEGPPSNPGIRIVACMLNFFSLGVK